MSAVWLSPIAFESQTCCQVAPPSWETTVNPLKMNVSPPAQTVLSRSAGSQVAPPSPVRYSNTSIGPIRWDPLAANMTCGSYRSIQIPVIVVPAGPSSFQPPCGARRSRQKTPCPCVPAHNRSVVASSDLTIRPCRPNGLHSFVNSATTTAANPDVERGITVDRTAPSQTTKRLRRVVAMAFMSAVPGKRYAHRSWLGSQRGKLPRPTTGGNNLQPRLR